MQSDANSDVAAFPYRDVEAEILFEDDVFGPVKALQLFAAIDRLPRNYQSARRPDDNGWVVSLTITSCPRIDRVLAKVAQMPTVISLSRREAVQAADGLPSQITRAVEHNSV